MAGNLCGRYGLCYYVSKIMSPDPILDKVCSVCGGSDWVDIETVTNVMPQPEEMFPVLLCKKHKKSLQDKTLDITLDASGKLVFVLKKKTP